MLKDHLNHVGDSVALDMSICPPRCYMRMKGDFAKWLAGLVRMTGDCFMVGGMAAPTHHDKNVEVAGGGSVRTSIDSLLSTVNSYI